MAAGLLLVALHVGFRAWVVYPSWFFLDDFNLLHQAERPTPGLSYLIEPYNGHLMPGGRLVAWLVAQSGHVNWSLAASITLALQAAAALTALWMLLALFGRRWGILGPLVVWLTSALTIPSFVWWAAALNFVAIQISFFAAVAAWVTYLRGRRARWLVVTTLAVAWGLFFWVKALLIVPVLAFLALAYFTPRWRRGTVTWVARRYWLATVALGGVAGGYVAYYVRVTPSQFEEGAKASVAGLADTMLGTSFATTALGGPWQWDDLAPPTAQVDAPSWAVSLAWATIAVVALLAALRRRNTGRAWLLLAGYLAVLFVLLYASRAQEFGSVIGLELRYLADASMVLVLVMALISLEMPGAPGGSTLREDPPLRTAVPPVAVALLLLAVSAGGVVSTMSYTAFWHEDNRAHPYLATVQQQVADRGRVELAAQVVPDRVMSQLAAPSNASTFLLPLVTDRVTFPDVSNDLMAIDEGGNLRPAAIRLGVRSEPGPLDGCGWRVTSRGRAIPLAGRAFDYSWWVRVGYLASGSFSVTFSAGGQSVEAPLTRGLGNVYFRVDGTFDELRIDGLPDGASACIDTVEVGDVVPGGGA